MIACLPMYDWPEVVSAWDSVWGAWADCLQNAPSGLTRFSPEAFKRSWSHPDLYLTQICALPFLVEGHEDLRPWAAFDLDISGFEPGGWHHSAIVVRAEEPRDVLSEFQGGRVARNSACSQTGWNALRMTVGPNAWPFFTTPFTSGGHRDSARAVVSGQADIASLDPLSWWLLQTHEPATAQKLRVLTWSVRFPSLPLVMPVTRNLPDAAAIAAVSTSGLPTIRLTHVDQAVYEDNILKM